MVPDALLPDPGVSEELSCRCCRSCWVARSVCASSPAVLSDIPRIRAMLDMLAAARRLRVPGRAAPTTGSSRSRQRSRHRAAGALALSQQVSAVVAPLLRVVVQVTPPLAQVVDAAATD